MRGLTVIALLIGGMPLLAFAATVALTDGAPIRAPSAGSGMPVAAHETPDIWLGQPAPTRPAGIPSWMATAPDGWSPPPSPRLRDDRANAGWDRLHRLAAAGDRDALVFLTLMKSGTIARPAARSGHFTP